MALTATPASPALIEFGARKWIIAFGIALAPLLETVDSTIVNVAAAQRKAIARRFRMTGKQVTGIPLGPWLVGLPRRRSIAHPARVGRGDLGSIMKIADTGGKFHSRPYDAEIDIV